MAAALLLKPSKHFKYLVLINVLIFANRRTTHHFKSGVDPSKSSAVLNPSRFTKASKPQNL